jgi:hypothetical protein
MMNRKMFNIMLAALLIIGGYILSNAASKDSSTKENVSQKLLPADAITHGHGLSVDVNDPNKLYIATHHGLMVLVNDKDLYNLSSKKDDYMGFSPHPSNSKILYSSGHPELGGNIGFQKSEDGGYTWVKVSDGVNGPVDFHAMAVSSSNPKVIYGWYKGSLQRSGDEGRNWNIVSMTSFPIVNLAVDPTNESRVYAATPQGLMMSENAGKDWNTLLNGYVSAIAIDPLEKNTIITFSEEQQLARSTNAGKSWEKINVELRGETPLYITYSTKQPGTVYILTEKNSIYKSTDGSASWSKIR